MYESKNSKFSDATTSLDEKIAHMEREHYKLAGGVIPASMTQPPSSELVEVRERLVSIDSVLREVIIRLRGLDEFLYGSSTEEALGPEEKPQVGGVIGDLFCGLDMTMKDANWIFCTLGGLAEKLGMSPVEKGGGR